MEPRWTRRFNMKRRGRRAAYGNSSSCCSTQRGVLERLALIALGRSAGFSLNAIALMFAPNGAAPRIDRQMLATKAEELDGTIRKLTEMRNSLRHAAACRAPSQMECPKRKRFRTAECSGLWGIFSSLCEEAQRV